ncbi:hypothetical protein DPMN_050390 [Dreissena polymorpha]|uniref:Uncharacterized protein n=1 Tax=Dreissena polymorpha TaxID=45954 RepID=A0A9D4HN08_DREPO|nr:hypothetical protein DPMN_050390 [Dreissena polymorpha]
MAARNTVTCTSRSTLLMTAQDTRSVMKYKWRTKKTAQRLKTCRWMWRNKRPILEIGSWEMYKIMVSRENPNRILTVFITCRMFIPMYRDLKKMFGFG